MYSEKQLESEIDNAYELVKPEKCKNWKECAGHAVYWLKERGVPYTTALKFVAYEISLATNERSLNETSAAVLDFVKTTETGKLEKLINERTPVSQHIDLVKGSHRPVVPLGSVPDKEYYTFESGGEEGHKPYRADPFESKHTLEHIGTDRD